MRRYRPKIRRTVRIDLHQQVADQALRVANRRGLSLSESVERLLRRDLARDAAERLVERPLRPPIAVVPWTWFRRRARRLLDTTTRTRRPVVVTGRSSPGVPASDLRGRDPRCPRPLGIRDGVVLLPVRRRLRRRLRRWS